MSCFRITLTARADHPIREAGPFDEELDNVTSLLTSVASELATDPATRFEVHGFGQSPWPTDVETDLPVVLEQLPQMIASIESGHPAVLDLYEQGLQRTLTFAPRVDQVAMECASLTSWQPAGGTLVVSMHELVAMLRSVLDTFLEIVRESFPGIAQHPWLIEWSHPASNS